MSLKNHYPAPLTNQELEILIKDHSQVPERFVIFARWKQLYQQFCNHRNWTWKKCGRVCPDCEIFVVDFGD